MGVRSVVFVVCCVGSSLCDVSSDVTVCVCVVCGVCVCGGVCVCVVCLKGGVCGG